MGSRVLLPSAALTFAMLALGGCCTEGRRVEACAFPRDDRCASTRHSVTTIYGAGRSGRDFLAMQPSEWMLVGASGLSDWQVFSEPLATYGVPMRMEGSIYYGIFVPKEDAELARRVLRGVADRIGRWVLIGYEPLHLGHGMPFATSGGCPSSADSSR